MNVAMVFDGTEEAVIAWSESASGECVCGVVEAVMAAAGAPVCLYVAALTSHGYHKRANGNRDGYYKRHISDVTRLFENDDTVRQVRGAPLLMGPGDDCDRSWCTLSPWGTWRDCTCVVVGLGWNDEHKRSQEENLRIGVGRYARALFGAVVTGRSLMRDLIVLLPSSWAGCDAVPIGQEETKAHIIRSQWEAEVNRADIHGRVTLTFGSCGARCPPADEGQVRLWSDMYQPSFAGCAWSVTRVAIFARSVAFGLTETKVSTELAEKLAKRLQLAVTRAYEYGVKNEEMFKGPWGKATKKLIWAPEEEVVEAFLRAQARQDDWDVESLRLGLYYEMVLMLRLCEHMPFRGLARGAVNAEGPDAGLLLGLGSAANEECLAQVLLQRVARYCV